MYEKNYKIKLILTNRSDDRADNRSETHDYVRISYKPNIACNHLKNTFFIFDEQLKQKINVGISIR